MKKEKFAGLSLRWDNHYIRNLIVVIGVVLVWRGIWNIVDTYLFPSYPLLSNITSIIIGVVVLYLPDGTLEHLGGYKKIILEEENKATKFLDSLASRKPF